MMPITTSDKLRPIPTTWMNGNLNLVPNILNWNRCTLGKTESNNVIHLSTVFLASYHVLNKLYTTFGFWLGTPPTILLSKNWIKISSTNVRNCWGNVKFTSGVQLMLVKVLSNHSCVRQRHMLKKQKGRGLSFYHFLTIFACNLTILKLSMNK